ncbi:MAG: M48 family metallopeptidase [Micavibrio sp.]|nr:M48 family metallopeptidase [Micavibrio sp.]
MRTLTIASALLLAATLQTQAQSAQPVPAATGAGAAAPSSQSEGSAAPQKDDAKTVNASTDQEKNGKDDKSAKNDKKDKNASTALKPEEMASPGEAYDPNIKKGSEEDVDAVGQRNIGGRGFGNWYSTNWEVGVGKQYSVELERSSHLVTDPVVVEYVNRVGQNLVRNSDAKVPFTIKVLDTDEINAMALPGGFFYVNSGLILACDSEDELAGVMAHEIAHVAAHHAARQMTKMNMMQIGSIPLMIFTQGTWTGYGIYEASQLAIPITFLKFSRIYEAEADYLGVQYAYKAGYDPQGMVTIFEKLDALEKHKPGALSKAFSDHPATPDRIDATENEIATILPARPDYLVTTSEFDVVKARLARIQNKRGLGSKDKPGKPTLRRASTSNNDPSSSSGSSTDDRPTLGRRD